MKTLIIILSILGGLIVLVATIWLIVSFCLLVPTLKDLANIDYTLNDDDE